VQQPQASDVPAGGAVVVNHEGVGLVPRRRVKRGRVERSASIVVEVRGTAASGSAISFRAMVYAMVALGDRRVALAIASLELSASQPPHSAWQRGRGGKIERARQDSNL
jgi:hypothetical protein